MHISTAFPGCVICPLLPPALNELWWCMGPPMRSQKVRTTLLGDTKKKIGWPSRMTVGLIFSESVIPVDFIEKLLARKGYASCERLREIYALPPSPLTCRAIGGKARKFLNAERGKPEEVLHQALLLGLCGQNVYDPLRPVIWTNSRLTRKVELFEVGEFYADN